MKKSFLEENIKPYKKIIIITFVFLCIFYFDYNNRDKEPSKKILDNFIYLLSPIVEPFFEGDRK